MSAVAIAYRSFIIYTLGWRRTWTINEQGMFMQTVHVKHFATANNLFISFDGVVVDVALDGAIAPCACVADRGIANIVLDCVVALVTFEAPVESV